MSWGAVSVTSRKSCSLDASRPSTRPRLATTHAVHTQTAPKTVSHTASRGLANQ